jgi:hypothetical protein
MSLFLLLPKIPIFQRILKNFLRLAPATTKVLMKNFWKMKMPNLHRQARVTEREGPKRPWTSTLKTFLKELGIRFLRLRLPRGLSTLILPRPGVARQ